MIGRPLRCFCPSASFIARATSQQTLIRRAWRASFAASASVGSAFRVRDSRKRDVLRPLSLCCQLPTAPPR